MARPYRLGGRRPAESPFPVGQFLAALLLVLGIAGAAGWYALRQPPTATIQNAAPVTRTVHERPQTKRLTP